MSAETNSDLASKVAAVLARYGRQNGWPANAATEIATVARRFAQVAGRADYAARRTEPAGDGEPPELAAELVAALTGELTAGLGEAERLALPVKQLVKGCFQAGPRSCRDEYREVDGAGVCRRQSPAKARGRVSGAFCVDCPYWKQLDAAQQERLLAAAWAGPDGAAGLAAQRDVFLPEDFRALRRSARV